LDENGGGLCKTRYRGLERVDFAGYLVATASTWFDWLGWRPSARRRCSVARINMPY